MASDVKGHGGKRLGAGRPKGSRMRRGDVLAEKLIDSGKCPVEALIRLADKAEAEGDIGQAIGAWKGVLPYIYPKPKAVDADPDEVVRLARELATVRNEVSRQDINSNFFALVEKRIAEMELEKSIAG